MVPAGYPQQQTETSIQEPLNSHYSSNSGLHPYDGQTTPAPEKGYSWLKAPRYGGEVMEVGPLARVMVAYMTPGHEWVKKEVDDILAATKLTPDKLNSVLGRHLARGLETKWLVKQLNAWLDELEIGPGQNSDSQNRQGFGRWKRTRHWGS
jgi:Ni,Fe-hydrogenase I large subunit